MGTKHGNSWVLLALRACGEGIIRSWKDLKSNQNMWIPIVFFDSRHLIMLNACALSGSKAWEFMGFACITCMWRRHNQELKIFQNQTKNMWIPMVFFDSRHLIILNACALSGSKAWEFIGFACIPCMWRRHNQELNILKIKPKHVNSHGFLRFKPAYHLKRMCSQWEQSIGIHGFCLHSVHVAKA